MSSYVLVRLKMDVQMTMFWKILDIVYHPFDVYCLLLFHKNFRFSIIYLSELLTFIFDNKSCYLRECFTIGRIL